MTESLPSQEMSQRLSRITTQWSVVFQAHGDSVDGAAVALQALFQQYNGCVYRYLLGATRDPDVAEELSHEFAVKFLRGDLHRANPERGRFRDYMKTVLINLVNDHFRSVRERPQQLSPDRFEPAASTGLVESELTFEACLSDDLLDRTWQALEHGNPRYYAVLKLRVEEPDLSAREMADQLTDRGGISISHDTLRKTLERARTKFADLLVDVTFQMLECETTDQLKAELKELGLLGYCRSALERRHDRAT